VSIKNITDIKSVLGSGFKRNYFTVVFDFNEHNKATIKKSIKNKTQYPKAEFLSYIKDILVGEYKLTIPNTLNNSLRVDTDIRNIGNNLKKDMLGDILEKYLIEDQMLYNLTKSFQLPGYEVEETPETVKNRTFIQDVKKGVMTCNIINDRFGLSYDFWRVYLKTMSGNQLLYPSQYEFNVKISTVLEFKNKYLIKDTPIRTFTFKKCFIKASPDLDFSMENKAAHDFELPIQFKEYSEKVETLSNNEFFADQFVAGTYQQLGISDFASLGGNI
jgi:hypothetical protein